MIFKHGLAGLTHKAAGEALPENLVPLTSREDIGGAIFSLPDAQTIRSAANDTGPSAVGGSTADRFWHTTGSSAGVRAAFGLDNDTYNYSAFLKLNGTNDIVRFIIEGTNVWFDLTNTTATGTGVITDAGGGWWRCSDDFTLSDSNVRVDHLCQTAVSGTTEETGDGTTNYIGMTGHQITLGTGVKTYNGST